jgi:hypothetical protein
MALLDDAVSPNSRKVFIVELRNESLFPPAVLANHRDRAKTESFADTFVPKAQRKRLPYRRRHVRGTPQVARRRHCHPF